MVGGWVACPQSTLAKCHFVGFPPLYPQHHANPPLLHKVACFLLNICNLHLLVVYFAILGKLLPWKKLQVVLGICIVPLIRRPAPEQDLKGPTELMLLTPQTLHLHSQPIVLLCPSIIMIKSRNNLGRKGFIWQTGYI